VIEKTRNQVFELLRKSVRPEFLNRVDELVMFRPLTMEHMEGIIRIQLRNLEKVLQKQEITIEVTNRCMDYLKHEGFDLQFGARPLKRLIQRKVLDGLSMAILEGRVSPGMHVKIDAEDHQVVFRPLARKQGKVADTIDSSAEAHSQ